MDDLFGTAPPPTPSQAGASTNPAHLPLAERMRPALPVEVAGQAHLVGPHGALTRMVAAGRPSSMILHGPPGVGKTTIARLTATLFGLPFAQLSALQSGVADVRRVLAAAEAGVAADGRATILFIDEIHRFNKAQQDSFLAHMESGVVVLVGATTENPSFQLNGALLSRAAVYELVPLDDAALGEVLARAEAAERPLPITPEARAALIADAGGDARHLLGQAEALMALETETPLDVEAMRAVTRRRAATHDRAGDGHYDLASAFQKSIRGSDPHAALYYGARLALVDEVPMLLRRLMVTASEEVGMADPSALATVTAAAAAFERLGMPEGGHALGQAIVHVATAPKSNAAYLAWGEAMAVAAATGNVPPPRNILNAPTRLMREQGRKVGYEYDHDAPRAFSGQHFWPEGMEPLDLYRPSDRGAELRVGERLAHWDEVRRARRAGREGGGA